MKYLFLDTSSEELVIAISDDNHIIEQRNLQAMNNYSKYALVELETIFKQSNLNPNDIDKLFIVNGPGSFTGVRIGVAIIKTYAWSLNKTVIPISSLKAYALSINNFDYCVSIIDARREAVYAGIYDKEYNNIIEEQYISIEDLNKNIDNLQGIIKVTGNIEINNNKTIPVKLDVMNIINYYKNNNGVNVHELKPNYLKKVEAEEKLIGGEK